MRKKVLLIGGRNKAKSLAISLINKGYKVTAINNNYNDCMTLAEIKDLTVINGDGTKPFILDEAGAQDCDISIALTPKDEDNLVASELCKKKFNVKKTVSIIADPNKTEFFRKMGIDSAVCAISAITGIIEQQTFIDEMTNIIPIGKGRVQIVEVQVPSDAPNTGKKLWEITLSKDVIIGCILRGDTTIIPRGDTRILAGDTLVVIASNGREISAVKELTGR